MTDVAVVSVVVRPRVRSVLVCSAVLPPFPFPLPLLPFPLPLTTEEMTEPMPDNCRLLSNRIDIFRMKEKDEIGNSRRKDSRNSQDSA